MLMPSMIIPPQSSAAALVVSRVFQQDKAQVKASHTYTGVALGTGDIYLVILAAMNGSTVTITGVTIGGAVATEIENAGVETAVAIFKLAGNTAATGDIVITCSSFLLGSSIDIYLTPGATEGSKISATGIAQNSVGLDMGVDAGSVIIGGAVQEWGTAATFNWTGITGDAPVQGSGFHNKSSVFQQNVTAGAPKTISVAMSAGGNNQNVAGVLLELK